MPHRQYKTIHIAGTNGKGSVATKMAAVLQHQGYKVGLYTSPHIACYRERIRINGEMISEERAEQVRSAVFREGFSMFSLLTEMAFLYFAQERVDYAVIEVGLGGRLDATNVITPIVSVITSIGLDHTAILGNSLEEIAREKGGIAKPGVPLIVGASAAPFFSNAIHVGKEPFYELENQAIARRALAEIGVTSEQGLQALPPCRFQRTDKLILDVAHNPPAFERLAEALQYHYPEKKFPFYLAFSKDKDWKSCLKIIRPLASEITFLKHNVERLIAFPDAKELCPIEGVVAGSFYIMEQIQRREGALSLSSHR